MPNHKSNPRAVKLPKDFGKPIELPPDCFFRPLTPEELAGFTEEDWASIRQQEAEHQEKVRGVTLE